MDITVIQLSAGLADLTDVQQWLNEISKDNPEVVKLAADAGIDAAHLEDLTSITVSEPAPGNGALFALEAAFTTAAGSAFGKEMAKLFWQQVVRPYIADRSTSDSVGEP